MQAVVEVRKYPDGITQMGVKMVRRKLPNICNEVRKRCIYSRYVFRTLDEALSLMAKIEKGEALLH